MKPRRKHYKNYDVNLNFLKYHSGYLKMIQEVSEDLGWDDLEEFLKACTLELIFYKTNNRQNIQIAFILCNYLEERK